MYENLYTVRILRTVSVLNHGVRMCRVQLVLAGHTAVGFITSPGNNVEQRHEVKKRDMALQISAQDNRSIDSLSSLITAHQDSS